uniref:hypothetical protein n=1 Tax=Cephaleuros karstenii TaxID=1985640 RepID=UPI001EDE1707|nr:hypothetical protein MFR52_pgp056 [Cephaleuros karstenii]UIB39103.1 hypothetical protein [Cephaleuros karstenii]
MAGDTRSFASFWYHSFGIRHFIFFPAGAGLFWPHYGIIPLKYAISLFYSRGRPKKTEMAGDSFSFFPPSLQFLWSFLGGLLEPPITRGSSPKNGPKFYNPAFKNAGL